MLKQNADYRSIETKLKQIREKREAERSKVEKELSEQRKNLENAEKRRDSALEKGTKEEYLEACSKVDRERNSVEYLNAKAKKLKEGYRVNLDQLRVFQRAIKKEQDTFTREGFKAILEEAEKLHSSCSKLFEEQKRGNSLYSEIVELFLADATPEEHKVLNSENLGAKGYTTLFGINQTIGVSRDVEKLLNNLKSDGVQEFLKGKE